MRLLVDLQGLQSRSSRNRGIGRYVRSLVEAVLRRPTGHDIRFLLNGLFDGVEEVVRSFGRLAEPEQFIVFSAPGPTSALNPRNGWRRHAAHVVYEKLVEDLAPDALLIGSLFEGGNDNAVISIADEQRSYVVATILYDLIPLIDPEGHIGSAGAREWYFGRVEQARRSDLLLGISQSACDEASTHLAVEDHQVRYIGAAAAEEFARGDFQSLDANESSRRILTYYGIKRAYAMHASAFDPRKNFEGLVAAFARLPVEIRRRHQLVLVCHLNVEARARLSKVIASADLNQEEVVLTGFVPDDDLRVLYANSSLFVFPSLHEGFGLPVVEAMWCGAPVIGSSLSSVPEVIGREDAQFDPNDLGAMTAMLARGLIDEEWRRDLRAHSAVHAARFCWSDVAQRALAALQDKVELRNGRQVRQRATMPNTISRLAEYRHWPSPSNGDLLTTAEALASNEKLQWPSVQPAPLGIPKATLV